MLTALYLSKPVPRYVGYKDLYYLVASPAEYGVSAEGKERKKERTKVGVPSNKRALPNREEA